MLGVRWAPFGPTRKSYPALPGASALYVRGEAGYTWLELSSATNAMTIARGFVGGAALGWLGVQATDWVGGIEISDHIAVLSSGAGTRDSFAVTAFVEWHLPFLFSR